MSDVFAQVIARPRQFKVKLPASRGVGRTLVCKTCKTCGELRMASDFAITGSQRNPDPTCRRCHALRRTTLPAKRLGRPLVAQTCHGCGHLKMAIEFTPHGQRKTVETRCRSCVVAAVSEWQAARPEEVAAYVSRRMSTLNARTLEVANHHGNQWTGVELEIALRDDLTTTEKAKMLGRTFYAVKSAIRKARHEPKWTKVAGVDDA